ncbi:Rha family transcriptional regulator [Desulfovibrio piger]|uniref:Rha family transcriptional regulator n=1 Tax=Desulfovibrio piger TaxID=901 RepID=UPI0032C0508A
MSQAPLLPSEHFSPSVSLHSGRPATTSLEVAKFFSKRHDNVLRDVDMLLSQLPENSLQLNFEETYQEQETPLGMKRVRMFILYRDGFMLLVMGYTGKKALAMKLAYIEAFNRMEEELARQHAASPSPTPEDFTGTLSITPSTTEDRKPLRALVGSWAQVSGLPFAACWNQLKAAFNIANIKELPQEWIPDAIDWVQKRIDALPAPAPATALPASPSSPTDDAEGHLAAIREHIRQIHRHEEALFLLARKALPAARKPGDMFSPARRTGLTAFQSMEDCAGALDYSLRALESSARTMLTLGR